MRAALLLRGLFLGQLIGLGVVALPCLLAMLGHWFLPGEHTGFCMFVAILIGSAGCITGSIHGLTELAPAMQKREALREKEMQKLLKESGL